MVNLFICLNESKSRSTYSGSKQQLQDSRSPLRKMSQRKISASTQSHQPLFAPTSWIVGLGQPGHLVIRFATKSGFHAIGIAPRRLGAIRRTR
jgi:hypothetical protein